MLMDHIYSGYNAAHLYRRSFVPAGIRELVTIYDDTPQTISRSQRVWLVLSHIRPEARTFLLNYFDRIGERLDTFTGQETAVYLYDLSHYEGDLVAQ